MRRRVLFLACLALTLSCGGGSSSVSEAFAADDAVVMVAGAPQLIAVLANDAAPGLSLRFADGAA